jgi:hypothetical protein
MAKRSVKGSVGKARVKSGSRKAKVGSRNTGSRRKAMLSGGGGGRSGGGR